MILLYRLIPIYLLIQMPHLYLLVHPFNLRIFYVRYIIIMSTETGRVDCPPVGMIVIDLEHDIRQFIKFHLKQGAGKTITSTELYNLYRESTGSNLSDVKLAELFSKYIQNKRISSGMIWLDYEIASQYNYVPDETAVHRVERIYKFHTNFCSLSDDERKRLVHGLIEKNYFTHFTSGTDIQYI